MNCTGAAGPNRYGAAPMGMQADYVRKIQGLLATAESLADQGNEEAAGAYVAKAHALQQKYSIDQAMLAEGEAPRAIVDRTWVMPGAYGRRKVNLAHVVAVHTGCAGYFARAEDGGYRFHVFGFTADVEWAETLFFSLCHQAEAALGFAERGPYEHGRSFTTAFLEGFTQEVGPAAAGGGQGGQGGGRPEARPRRTRPGMGAAWPWSWPTRPSGWTPSWPPRSGGSARHGCRAPSPTPGSSRAGSAGRDASLDPGVGPLPERRRPCPGEPPGTPARRLRRRGGRPGGRRAGVP